MKRVQKHSRMGPYYSDCYHPIAQNTTCHAPAPRSSLLSVGQKEGCVSKPTATLVDIPLVVVCPISPEKSISEPHQGKLVHSKRFTSDNIIGYEVNSSE
jgi:hypothetical protein